MGYDCINYLPANTPESELVEFLLLLGFVRLEPRVFLKLDKNDYSFHHGIRAEIEKVGKRVSSIHTHSWSFRSSNEALIHNATVRHIRQRFGGAFRSDLGKGRYLPRTGHSAGPAEAGSHDAYIRFQWSMMLADNFVESLAENVEPSVAQAEAIAASGKVPGLFVISPLPLAYSMLVVFLVAAVEDYLRSVYTSLLRSSKRKALVLGHARLRPAALLAIADEGLLIEEAVAAGQSFMDLPRAAAAFRELDPALDILGELRRPYRGRKTTLEASLVGLVSMRHAFVHRGRIHESLDRRDASRSLNDLKAAVRCLHRHFGRVNHWSALSVD